MQAVAGGDAGQGQRRADAGRALGQVWAEVEQGGWELGRGLAALMLSLGQGAWACILIPPLLPSLFCSYLYLGLFLTFPASSSMSKRRYPMILPPPPSSTAS